MLRDDLPPHSAAVDWSVVAPSGRLRWNDGVLQQEWHQQWWNELGTGVVKEWRDVPNTTE